jgi:hypothetical protein
MTVTLGGAEGTRILGWVGGIGGRGRVGEVVELRGLASSAVSGEWAAEDEWGGGGAEGTRTPDFLLAKEALSQLSYSPAQQRYYSNKLYPPQLA